MRTIWIAALIITATAAVAQTGEIFNRLRAVLASSGQGDLAAAELARSNFTHVEQLLAAVQPAGPAQSAELLSLEGAISFLARNMAASAQKFDQAAKFAPLTDADSFTLAMALINLSNVIRARTILDDLAARHPEQSIYVYWLGKLDYDERRYESATDRLTRATELDSKSYQAWDALALAFDMQGRIPQAQASFEKAVELNHHQTHPSPWPPGNYGYLLLRMDKPGKAEEMLRESLSYDDRLAQTHYHLARTLEKEGQDDPAIEEYRKAMVIDKSATDACYSLAILYRKLHRDDEATAMFNEYRRRRQASNASSEAPR